MLQETHSVEGRAAMLKLPKDTAALWSNGSSHQAGVGRLVKHSFLANFNLVVPQNWVETSPVHAAVLRLREPNGASDLMVIYTRSGEAAQDRRETMRLMSVSITPLTHSLNVGERLINQGLPPPDPEPWSFCPLTPLNNPWERLGAFSDL